MNRAWAFTAAIVLLIIAPAVLAPTTTDYFPGTQVIDKGTQTGGSFPGDVDDSNDVRVNYQEGDQAGAPTDLVVDSQNVDVGTQPSGTFPGDVTSSNNAYITYREANTGGGLNEPGDIAYKSNTGSCAVAAVNCPKVTDWTGSAWGTPEVVLATAGAAVTFVSVVWNPLSDSPEHYIVTAAGTTLTVYRCTAVDTCSSDTTATVTAVGTAPERHFDLAFEQSSRDLLLVYDCSTGITNDICYKTKPDGGSWSSETNFDHASLGNAAEESLAFIVLASNPGVNDIALGAYDTTNDDYVMAEWDGSAWRAGASQNTCSVAVTLTNGLGGSVYTEDTANEFVAYCGRAVDLVAECEWTAGAGWETGAGCVTFDPDATASTDTKAFNEGGFREGSNAVLVCVVDDNADLTCWRWTGVTGVGGARAGLLEVTGLTGSGTTIAMPADIDWSPDQSGTEDALLVYYNAVSGSMTYRTWNDATPVFSATSTFSSASTHLWVEVIGTEQASNTVKAHVCTSNAAFDILCYRWNSGGAPASEQTITADTVDETYRYWGLAFTEAQTASNYQLQVRYNWVGETCLDTRRLRVEGHHTSGEDFLVQTVDSTEVTWTTRFTITATADPNTYQTFDIDVDTWDSGAPNVRFLGATESSDTTQNDLILDHVQFLCVPPADYEAQWKYSWTGVPTAGTEWRLFVEGLQLTNAETLEVRIFAADDVALSGIVCSITSTIESELDCGTLTADQLDGGSPDIQFRDANQATEGLQSSWGLDRVRIRLTDGDPTISSRTNTPASGTSLTAFDFAAVYTDDITCPASLFDVSFNSGGSWTALTATDGGDTNCTDGKAYNLVPDRAGFCPGTRTYRFRTSDGVNPTVTDPSDVTFTVTNIAPSVTPDLAAESTPFGTAYVRTFDHSDNDVTIACQTATWTVPVGPPECTIAAGALTCDGTLAVGTYDVTVRVNDGTASSDESFVLEVEAAGEDPEFFFVVRAMFACTYDAFRNLACVDRSTIPDTNVEIVSRTWFVDGWPVGSGRTLELSSLALAVPWEGGFWATDDVRIALTVQTRLGASSTCDTKTARNIGTPCFTIAPVDNALRSVGLALVVVLVLLAQPGRRQ